MANSEAVERLKRSLYKEEDMLNDVQPAAMVNRNNASDQEQHAPSTIAKDKFDILKREIEKYRGKVQIVAETAAADRQIQIELENKKILQANVWREVAQALGDSGQKPDVILSISRLVEPRRVVKTQGFFRDKERVMPAVTDEIKTAGWHVTTRYKSWSEPHEFRGEPDIPHHRNDYYFILEDGSGAIVHGKTFQYSGQPALGIPTGAIHADSMFLPENLDPAPDIELGLVKLVVDKNLA